VRRSQRMSTLTKLGWSGLGWDGGEERGGGACCEGARAVARSLRMVAEHYVRRQERGVFRLVAMVWWLTYCQQHMSSVPSQVWQQQQ
jgi:hypothetical protein